MRHANSFLAVTLTLAVSVLSAEQLQYVATNGDDANDGLAAASFVNCAMDGEVPNDSCITAGTDAFKGYADGNYRLRGGSPLVNAGVPVTLHSTVDLTRQSRVFGKRIDIGCYEAHVSGLLLGLR